MGLIESSLAVRGAVAPRYGIVHFMYYACMSAPHSCSATACSAERVFANNLMAAAIVTRAGTCIAPSSA